MKKVLSLLLIAALSATMLVACGNSDDSSAPESTDEPGTVAFIDGIYRAEALEFHNGYKEFMEVTYTDGVITNVVFDAVNEEDATLFKSSLTIEEYPMFDTEGNDFQPSVWYPTLEENVKNAAAPEDIALIADATHSCESAREFFAAIQENAKTGDTTTVIVGEPTEPAAE